MIDDREVSNFVEGTSSQKFVCHKLLKSSFSSSWEIGKKYWKQN